MKKYSTKQLLVSFCSYSANTFIVYVNSEYFVSKCTLITLVQRTYLESIHSKTQHNPDSQIKSDHTVTEPISKQAHLIYLI